MSTEDQTPLTPPPPASSAPHPAPGTPLAAPATSTAEPSTSKKATPIVVITAVVGGIALLGAGGTAAFAAMGNLNQSDSSQTQEVEGVEELDLRVAASDVTVRFEDVAEAELTVTGGRGDWTLRRDGEELIVRSPDGPFGWFGGWFDNSETVVLTLPNSLSGSAFDADFHVDAGSLDVSGDFGDVELHLGAGAIEIDGAARKVEASVSAGRADLTLDGVKTADLQVSAGNMRAEFTGTAPTKTNIDVSAGQLRLTLPDVAYNITHDVSAGSFDTSVQTSSSSQNHVDVEVSAGSVVLKPGD